MQKAETIGATSVQATGGGVWPTVNRRINCQYMGYSGHTGIDLGGAIGTAIYAYKTGTVSSNRHQKKIDRTQKLNVKTSLKAIP